MKLLAALLALVLPSAEAMRMAINCSSTADCGDGETCVAGDSALSVQACVAGAGCGGSATGNCPSDAANGQLACIWQASSDCGGSGEGCAQIGGNYGIYKCLSIDRCDEYYGGSSCSDGCSVNGVQCNGQGSCSLVSSGSDGTPTFGCSCNEGFSGDKCESGSSSGSTTASTVSSTSSSTASSTSVESSSSTSSSRATSSSTSSSVSGSSSTSSSTSSSVSGSSSTSSSVSGSGSFSSVNGSLSSSSSSSLSASSTEGASNNAAGASPTSANSGSVASESDSGGTSSAVFIIIGVLAACIIIGALMFAMYSRKKKREQEAEAGGFGGATPFGAATAAESEALGGTGADTPKSSIVTM
ncbi:hypothetical protein KRP22_011565 [Phytophthora ramorum]|nr:hypothetical protein KRP22_10770 [Phytophthora ramorum]